MISMTGYGQAIIEKDQYKITVEAKSVNNRFCEIVIRMPRRFLHLEDQLKKVIQGFVYRGKVDVFVTVEGEGLVNKKIQMDWNLFEQYVELAREAQDKVGLSTDLQLKDLLFHEQIASIVEVAVENEDVQATLFHAAKQAAFQLAEMRKVEGRALHNDLEVRIASMQKQIQQLTSYAPSVTEYYRERLTKRIQDFLTNKIEIEEARLLTEVAIFADKSNIDEELTRLNSHLEQFLASMKDGGVIGRKLDFLVQEMNRETNTIGSKANDVQISQQVVELKSNIEKIKEQVQNIE
jgi:uncharacterized protein (TIGR00255 family)